MKKLLLTGIAALSVHCASAAHAADQLPGYMLGRWCYSNASTKTQEVYFRPNLIDPERSTCSDLTDGIMLVRRDMRTKLHQIQIVHAYLIK